MIPDINNLGTFTDIDAVWAAYPEGGNEGDYLYIGTTKYRWNKYERVWKTAGEVTESPARKLVTNYGDMAVNNDLHVGGTLYYHRLQGYDLGLFGSLQALQTAHPTPKVGQWAFVVHPTIEDKYQIYSCETAGTWTLSVSETTLDVLSFDKYEETLELMQQIANGRALTGYRAYSTLTDLPTTDVDPTLGYLVGGHLYVWVETGGDTLGGKYQDCGLLRGEKGEKGDKGNTGISIGDNFEAFSTLPSIDGKTTAEKEAMVPDGNAVTGLLGLTYDIDKYYVNQYAGVVSYINGARLNSSGVLGTNTNGKYFSVPLALAGLAAGDVLVVKARLATSSSSGALEVAFFATSTDQEGHPSAVAVGDTCMEGTLQTFALTPTGEYEFMGYVTVPVDATHLVFSVYKDNSRSIHINKVRNVVDSLNQNITTTRDMLMDMMGAENVESGSILGIQIDMYGNLYSSGDSKSHITYFKRLLPKNTLIHFTGTASTARSMRYCICDKDPQDSENPLVDGDVVELLYNVSQSGVFDDYIIMPRSGWFLYGWYADGWTERNIKIYIQSSVRNKIGGIYSQNILENWRGISTNRRLVRGDTGAVWGTYGSANVCYTTGLIDVSWLDKPITYRLPFGGSIPSKYIVSGTVDRVAMLAAYDEEQTYLEEYSVLLRAKGTAAGTWERPSAVKYVRFTVYSNSGKNDSNIYANVQGTLESRIDALENASGNKTINELNEDREGIISQCQNSTSYTNPLLRLVHFSDLHGDATRLKRIIEWCNEHENMIDDIVNTGDVVKDKFSDGNPYGTGTSMIPGAQYILTAIGNHDCASKYYPLRSTTTSYDWYARRGSSLDGSDTKVYNRFIKPYIKTVEEDPETGEPVEVDNWGVTQPDDAEENGYTWYYKDYTGGYRLIVLDSMNYTSGTGSAAVDDINFGVQRAWYQSVLEDARQKNLSVITAYHFLYRARHGIKTNMMPWGTANGSGYGSQSIIGSTTKSSSMPDYVKVYSNSAGSIIDDTQAFIDAGGKFICHLVGHSHGDRIFYAGSQASRDGSTPTKQIAIMVDAACCTSSAKHYGSVRVAKGRAQDSFNYVCFNKDAQRITIVKIGVDANVYGQHVDWASVYYGGDKAEQYMHVGNTTYTTEEYIEPDHDDDGNPDD